MAATPDRPFDTLKEGRCAAGGMGIFVFVLASSALPAGLILGFLDLQSKPGTEPLRIPTSAIRLASTVREYGG